MKETFSTNINLYPYASFSWGKGSLPRQRVASLLRLFCSSLPLCVRLLYFFYTLYYQTFYANTIRRSQVTVMAIPISPYIGWFWLRVEFVFPPSPFPLPFCAVLSPVLLSSVLSTSRENKERIIARARKKKKKIDPHLKSYSKQILYLSNPLGLLGHFRSGASDEAIVFRLRICRIVCRG